MATKAPTISFVDALRKNRSGALLSGIIVTVAAALLLSTAVTDDINTVIAVMIIVLLAAAIGFMVKVTSAKQDGPSLLTAGALAALGVPLMFGAGGYSVMQGSLNDYGLSFDDSILSSLFESYLTVGSALAAVVAIIVAAWGSRSE